MSTTTVFEPGFPALTAMDAGKGGKHLIIGPDANGDPQTRSEVQAPQARAALRSVSEDQKPSGASEVDVWFGPEQPLGAESRWLQIVTGRGRFANFRTYGPGPVGPRRLRKPGDMTLES